MEKIKDRNSKIGKKKYLNFGERLLLGEGGIGVGDETADGGLAVGVEAHVQCDGTAGLGAAADMVELESHQGFDEGALAVGLVADDENRRRVERRLELLSQAVELVVGLVQHRFLFPFRRHFFFPARNCRLVSCFIYFLWVF